MVYIGRGRVRCPGSARQSGVGINTTRTASTHCPISQNISFAALSISSLADIDHADNICVCRGLCSTRLLPSVFSHDGDSHPTSLVGGSTVSLLYPRAKYYARWSCRLMGAHGNTGTPSRSPSFSVMNFITFACFKQPVVRSQPVT